MSYNPSSPVTGASMADLTTPTFTLTADVSPNSHSVQHAVTALGGTQSGVVSHSVSSPFTITMERPANFRALPKANPVTGVVNNVPRNVYTLRTRKGVTPLAGQAKQILIIETKISVPAGADEADAANIQAALSAHIGTLSAQSSGIGDTCSDGIL